MVPLSASQPKTDQHNDASRRAAAYRWPSLRVLFVHRDADEVDSCLQELKRAEFAVEADIVLTLGQCVEQLGKEQFDLIVAEYPSPNWSGTQALQVLRQVVQNVPVIFVAASLQRECKRRCERMAHTILSNPHVWTTYQWPFVERSRKKSCVKSWRKRKKGERERKHVIERSLITPLTEFAASMRRGDLVTRIRRFSACWGTPRERNFSQRTLPGM